MSLHEAERQFALARDRIDVDVLRVAGHVSAAWDVTDEAEGAGAPAEDLRDLRLRLLGFGLSEWVPRVVRRIAALTPDGREEMARGLANAIRSGIGWLEREATPTEAERLGALIAHWRGYATFLERRYTPGAGVN